MNPPKRLDELLISRGAAFLRDQNASTSLEKRVMFLARQGALNRQLVYSSAKRRTQLRKTEEKRMGELVLAKANRGALCCRARTGAAIRARVLELRGPAERARTHDKSTRRIDDTQIDLQHPQLLRIRLHAITSHKCAPGAKLLLVGAAFLTKSSLVAQS